MPAMRAVVCRELGPPESLQLEERDQPEAGLGQVLIDVRAAGVNFVDGLFVAGQYQIKPPLPFVPGSEVAGIVADVGEGSAFERGDRVLAMPGLGGFAESVVVGEAQVSRLPDGLSFAQGATFVQSYCTALFALRERARLQEGETVLVLGAGGGVGLAVVDVAGALGARVVAVASTDEKRAAASAAGAFAVLDPGREDVKARARELSDGGVDVVVDPVGGALAEPALRSLGWFGRYLVIGFAAGEIPRLPANQILLNNRTVLGVDWGAWTMRDGRGHQALLDDALELAGAGRVSPVHPVEYPLERVADALSALLGRQATGKVALVP
jgi:NADPH2:quinone reductase